MKTLIRVKTADLRIPRDEYGNEFPSRDFGSDVNEAYVTELAGSFKADGEPDVPLSVVRDGDGYAVADGQSRLHAMKHLGTEECWCVLDDEATVKEVIETIVRTNKKKRYEPAEESRVVQQLAAFGDDDYVSGVASIDADKARRMRRAREMVGAERAEQLSLDRLYTVAEFDGDEDAVKQLVEAPENKWERVADELKRKAKLAAERAAFEAEAARLNIQLVDEYPHGNKSYICRCRSAEDMAADYMAASARATEVVGFLSDNWYSMELNFYGKKMSDEGETPEEAERRRLGERYAEVAQRIDDDMLNWVLDVLGSAEEAYDITDLKALNSACRKVARKYWYMKEALDLFPMATDDAHCCVLFAVGYKNTRKRVSTYAVDMARESITEIAADRMNDALEWAALHEADGWLPDEAEAEFLALAREKVAGALEDAEQDEEDE